MNNNIKERRIYSEKFGSTWRDIIEKKCDCCGETKIVIKEYDVKTDEEAMAEFFGTDA